MLEEIMVSGQQHYIRLGVEDPKVRFQVSLIVTTVKSNVDVKGILSGADGPEPLDR